MKREAQNYEMIDMKKGSDLQIAGLNGLKSLPARVPLGRTVYENLKKAIIKGELSPGSRVVESRLATVLNISRTPVREAFHKLEREGLLMQYPSGGYFVVGLTRDDIEETFGIRCVLESYAARLAAIKHKKEELDPLEENIREYRKCLDKGEIDSLMRINTEFHDLLYALSHSPRLIKMINNLREQIYRYRGILLKIGRMAKASNEDHQLMLKLIRDRDVEGVERVVRTHILRGQEVVLQEFDMQHNG